MKPLRVVAAARRELLAAAKWYDARQQGLGDELIEEVDRTLRRIAEAPRRYALWRSNRPYRRLRTDRFPYVVFYEDRDDHVRVHAIAHASRRPGYWLRRGS